MANLFEQVFPGKLRSADIFRMIPVTSDTSVEEIMVSALDKFGLDASDINKFRLSEVTLDKGSVHERVMDNQECPWELLRGIARVSSRIRDDDLKLNPAGYHGLRTHLKQVVRNMTANCTIDVK